MDLRDCKFYYGGQEMSFSVFSNDSCRARYLDSISIPFIQTRVDVYEIEPGPKTRWVLVKQKDNDKDTFRLFIRQGKKFLENQSPVLSKELRDEILGRYPSLLHQFHSPLAA